MSGPYAESGPATCNCTPNSIDGLDIERMQAWELALRNAAHGHYAIKGEVVAHAVRHIEALHRRVKETTP